MKQRTQKTAVFSQSKGRAYLAALISAALLSGCVSPSSYEMAETKSVSDFQYQQAFNDIETMNWPSDQWWTVYGDVQLNQLMDVALNQSPTMAIAQARLKGAAAIAQQVGALKKLQVGSQATASMTKVSYGYQMPPNLVPADWNDFGTLTLNFSYDFDFWGKNKAMVAAAASDLAATQAENAATRLMLSTSVANAYAELARLYANLDSANEAVSVRKQTLDLLNQRYLIGLETKGAVSQATSAAASVEANQLMLEEAIALQKAAIVTLLGEGPDQASEIQRPSVELTGVQGLPGNIAADLLGHRPDISAARWSAQSAAERIGAAKAQFYPDVNLAGFFGYQAFGVDNLFNTGNDAGSIGPAIYLPIFSGGRLEGQLSAAHSHYELAVASYNQTLAQALNEVANVMTSSRALDAQLDKTREAYNAAKEAHQIASDRYEGGLSTYLDVLSAEDALINSQRAFANLQAREFSLEIALVHALGGGYQADAQ